SRILDRLRGRGGTGNDEAADKNRNNHGARRGDPSREDSLDRQRFTARAMTTETHEVEAPAAIEDPFVFGGKPFRSRLIVGTGKYATFAQMPSALQTSAAEIVTVAVRRVNLT